MAGKVTLPILGQPDPNELSDVHLVGRYAVGATWADNHGSIYPFEELRLGCQCGRCAGLGSLTPEMVWPGEIKRLPEGVRVTWTDGHASLYPYRELRALCRCAECIQKH